MKKVITIVVMFTTALILKAQTSQTFSDSAPLRFTSFGTGTYDKTVLYHNKNNGFWLELARLSDDINANPIDYNINVRGGNKSLFTIKGVSGNVGIGTKNPAAKLVIQNKDNQGLNILIDKALKGTWPAVEEKKTVTLQSSGVHVGNLAFANGNSETMRINTLGYVGIGTTSPTEKLEVNGNILLKDNLKFKYAGKKIEYYGDADHRAHVQLYNASNGNIEIENFWDAGNADIVLKPDNNVIVSNGNVGIGIVQPKETLTVSKHGVSIGIYDTNPSSKANNRIARYGNSLVIQNDLSGSWLDNINFMDNGSVGIGVRENISDYKLAVAGKTITEEVKVQLQTNWPDYVFSKEYKLPTLKEVEKYIEEKGHLPNIPSADEVKENKGIELGKMNAKLLQKIEELTLYTIQQEKEIQELKNQNKQLKKLTEEIALIKAKLK